jgi:hypothetical protein
MLLLHLECRHILIIKCRNFEKCSFPVPTPYVILSIDVTFLKLNVVISECRNLFIF